MAIIIILIPILLAIFILNGYLKKKGKQLIPEGLAIPASLFVVMLYVAYELAIPYLHVIIIAFFGIAIGSLIEHSFRNKEN